MSINDIITAIFRPHRGIGPITAQITIEETHSDDLVITKHPVEQGSAITDHSFKMPPTLVINCAWSNSGLSAFTSQVQSIVSALQGVQVGLGTFNEAERVYAQLLALQASRIPFDITTGKRKYYDMLIQSIGVVTNQTTHNSLFVRLVCEQVVIVQTQAVLLVPTKDMKAPKQTAGTLVTGTKQAVPTSPSPGGASPPAGNAFTSPWGDIQSTIRDSGGGI